MNQANHQDYASALLETTGRAYVDMYRIKHSIAPTQARTAVDTALCNILPEGARYNLASTNFARFMHANRDDDMRLYVELYGSAGITITQVSAHQTDLAVLVVRRLAYEFGQTLIVDTPFAADVLFHHKGE